MVDFIFDTIKIFFGGNKLLYHTVIALLYGIGILIFGKFFKFFLNTIGKKLIGKTESNLDDKIIEIILERIIAISGITALYIGLKELRLGLTSSNTFFLSFIEYSNHALFLASALVVTSVVIRILKTLSTHALYKFTHAREHVGLSLTPLVHRVVSLLISLFAIMVVLDHFGQNISSVLTILGAGSLALGLAAQDTISNMISGFIIMLDRPFRIGDRIKIPSGEIGEIFEIGLRSTKILDFDNNLIIVPNNELIKTKVVNMGYPAGETRVVVDVSVAYGTDIQLVKNILLEIANNNSEILKSTPPEVFLINLGEWALQLKLYCRVESYKIQFKIAEELRVAIYNALRQNNIEIPFPQHAVHLKKQ